MQVECDVTTVSVQRRRSAVGWRLPLFQRRSRAVSRWLVFQPLEQHGTAISAVPALAEYDLAIASISAWFARYRDCRYPGMARTPRDDSRCFSASRTRRHGACRCSCAVGRRRRSNRVFQRNPRRVQRHVKRSRRGRRREEADERVGIVVLRAMRARRDAYTVCAVVRIPLRRPQATARQCMAPQSMCAVRLRPR